MATYAPRKAFVDAIIQHESGGDPNATNPDSSATGLMQITKGVAKDYGVDPATLKDPKVNRDLGTRYLGDLLVRFGGDERKAAIAYRQGPNKQEITPVAAQYAENVLKTAGEPATATDVDPGDAQYLRQQADQAAYERGRAYLEDHPEIAQQMLKDQQAKQAVPTSNTSKVEAERKAVEGGGTDMSFGALDDVVHDTTKKIALGIGDDPETAEWVGNASKNVVAGAMLLTGGLGLYDRLKPGASAFEAVKGAEGAATAAEGAAPAAESAVATSAEPSAVATSPTAAAAPVESAAATEAAAAPVRDFSTPQAASQTLAQKQADVIQQLRMGEKGAERFGVPELATKVPAKQTMAEGEAMGVRPEDVFAEPPKHSSVAAESSALIDVLDNEAKDIHLTAADLTARQEAGEDVSAAKNEWWNRYQAYALQAPKPIAKGSDVARAVQLFDPRRVAIQRIAQTGRIAQEMPEGAVDQAMNAVSKLTSDQLAASAYMTGRQAERGATWSDALLQGYKFGLILNPKTIARNIVSNQITQGLEVYSRWAAAKMPGSQVAPGEAAAMVEGWTGGVKDALKLAIKSARTAKPEWDIMTEGKLADTEAFQVPHVQYLEGPAISGDAFGIKGTPLGNAVDYIGAKVEQGYAITLMAPDQFYKATGSSMQMYALAWRQATEATAGLSAEKRPAAMMAAYNDILSKMSPDLIASSRDYADFTTFQNNLDRGWTKTLNNVTNDWPILQVIMPFRRTPLNVVEYGLDWLPLPIINRNWKSAIIRTGPETDIARAKIATGSAIAATLAHFYLQGRVKGEGAQNPELKKIQRDLGIQPNSFKVGDEWIGFPEPLKVPMSLVATAAEMMDHVDDDLTKTQIGMAVTLATAKAFTSAPALDGLNQMFQAMDGINNDDPRKGQAYLEREAAGMMPLSSMLRQISRASDPEYKESYGFMQKIGSNIPGTPFSEFPTRDYTGTAVHGKPGIVANMLSPIDFSKETLDPVDDELLAMGVKIPPVPRQLFGNAAKIMQSPNDPAIGIPLTPKQRDDWAIFRGEGIKRDLESEINSGEYKAASDYGKRALLGQIFADHGQDAQDKLLDKHKDLERAYDALLDKRDAIYGPSPTAVAQ